MIPLFSKDRIPKAFVAFAIGLELVIIVVYGLFGNILMNDSNLWKKQDVATAKFYYYFLMNLNNIYFGLVLLAGFGLVMVYLKHSSWSALGFSLLITCICVQLYPLVSTFWNSVFVTGFNNDNIVLDPTFSMNGCIRVAVAMLVVLAALMGRIGLLDSLLIGIVGTIIYSLSISVNIAIARSRSAGASINDVGGAIDIFLFGGILGVVVGKLLKTTNTLIHPRCTVGPGNQSPIFALIGTMFIWCGFFYLSINDPINQKYMNLGVMNTLLCMSACVVTIVSLAAIIHLRIGILEIVFGTISGGVIIGSCSMLIVNPSISILLGVISGVVTYWYLHMAHKWMNMEGIVDSTGVIGVYIINGIISPIFSCILIAFYATYPTWKPLFLGVPVGVDGGMANATFQLIHLGVTAAIAILTGIFLGFVLKCIGSKEEIHQLFQDLTEFSGNYQLTTMPVVVLPPIHPKPFVHTNQTSTNRLFENNINAIPPNRANIIHPTPLQRPASPIQRPVSPQLPYNARPFTPPMQQNFIHPGRPLSPIQTVTPVQIRSIIYEQPPSQVFQNKGITSIPLPYPPLSPLSSNYQNIFQLPSDVSPNSSRKY